MSVAVNVAPQNASIIETLWTMLKPLDSNIRLALGEKLIESVKKKEKTKGQALSDKIKDYKVSQFINSLPVKSQIAIPNDENGMDAMLDLKYGI